MFRTKLWVLVVVGTREVFLPGFLPILPPYLYACI
jgi:hypothetical protein